MSTIKSIPIPSIEDLKGQAKRLRQDLESGGNPISHSRALEIVAHQYGYKDWNTLHAAAGNRIPPSPVTVGERVRGYYLGQPFKGEAVGVQALQASGRFRVTFQFDEPVDVVTFDSFSAYRHRVSCTIGRDGKTVEKTSNGEPQLALE